MKRKLKNKFSRNGSSDKKSKGSKAQKEGVGAGTSASCPDAGPGQILTSAVTPGALRYNQHSTAVMLGKL